MIPDFFRGYPAKAWKHEVVPTQAQRRELDAAFGAMLTDSLDAALHEDRHERMRALTIAGGDVRVAKHLLYGQVLFDTGRIG